MMSVPELELDVDDVLGRQEDLRPVEVRGEGDAVVADLGQRGQAVDLEAAAVGQDGLGPGDEGVQAAQGLGRPRPPAGGRGDRNCRG